MDQDQVRDYAQRMLALFTGSDVSHGVTLTGPPATPGEKYKPGSHTDPGPPTAALWASHLAGQTGLGVTPARDDGKSYFGAIDIDKYTLGIPAFLAAFAKLGTCGIPAISKSGGIHVYFFTAAVHTGDFQSYLAHVAGLLGHRGAEIFPKQDHTVVDRNQGNWINMPYFGATRRAMRQDGSPLPIEDFLSTADNLRMSQTKLADEGARLLLGAPNCLLGVLGGETDSGPGNRHRVRVAYASYIHRTAHTDPRSALEWFTEHYTPGDYTDDLAGIERSTEKADYKFKCLIANPCPRKCSKSADKAIQGPSELDGEACMVRYDTAPPIYTLMYTDAPDVVISVDDLVSPVTMKKRWIAAWGRIPQIPKRDKWEVLVNRWLANVTIIEPPSTASAKGQFLELLEGHCRAAKDTRPSLRRAWVDRTHHVFTMQGLMAYLDQMRFKDMERNQVGFVLHEMQAESRTVDIGPRRVSAFAVPLYPGFELPTPAAPPSEVI